MHQPSPHLDPGGTSRSQSPATIGREISLLPRHWAWLSAQPRSASASLRWLVEEASRDTLGSYAAQKRKEACYFLMRDKAGDSPLFEDASRALFANDIDRLKDLVGRWPADVVQQLMPLAVAACTPGTQGA